MTMCSGNWTRLNECRLSSLHEALNGLWQRNTAKV